jgi:hypothetical protein
MLSTNMAPLTSILDVITSTAIYTRQERKKTSLIWSFTFYKV